MQLYRLRVVPESPWLTPWQSDTLAGLLCWACARSLGARVLRERIIEPALNGDPPFVLSDAFPEDWLPVPASLPLLNWPAQERKAVKRARWIGRACFRQVQRGRRPQVSDLVLDPLVREYLQLRNAIRRGTGNTTANGGLYSTYERTLGLDVQGRPLEYLTIYVRGRPEDLEFLLTLFHELAAWGFGADRSAGKGQFRLTAGLEEVADLDDVSEPTGCLVLSTFQPNRSDPTEGAWRAFTKYGKLGPDFGVENVLKRPLVLLRPGACFRSTVRREWVGRAVPADELLAPDVATHAALGNAKIVHWAFGLAVPIRWCDKEIGPADACAAAEGASPGGANEAGHGV